MLRVALEGRSLPVVHRGACGWDSGDVGHYKGQAGDGWAVSVQAY